MTSESAGILPAINGQAAKNLGEVNSDQNKTNLNEGDFDKQLSKVDKNDQVDIYQSDSKKIIDVRDDMIPEELLYSLSQTQHVVGKKKSQQLAPLKDLKSAEKLKTISKKGPPANLWHYKGRRTQFKHLTDNPRSMGKGVGTRDISFLYDVVHQHEPSPPSLSKLDKSAIRVEALEGKTSSKIAVPDTIIPEEYHLVKTKGVLGLEYVDEQTATLAKDHEHTLRVFPSLKPNKRFEVLQLLQTLEAMLEESGVHDDSVEVKGPTQIHNLLELIKKEQNIYDLVFSEVIRQASVECVERGQLLSQLRQSYAELLNRIPRQIQSLHAEVMAQRSLDRRLTEELVRFKSSISFLTKELQAVREHDHHVTTEAQMAEEELAKALKESQTNANLVDEYHNLYELQRKRLEASVNDLTVERDLWSNAAYNLALKITDMNSLNTAKRLHVSEKAWSKLAKHFIVMLNDHDSECLAEMQQHVEKWRSTMFHFNQDLEVSDKGTIGLLQKVRKGIETWMQKYEDILIDYQADIRVIKDPPKSFVQGICDFLKSSEEEMAESGERFAGGMLLSNEERISTMQNECEAWTEIGWDIYRRHRVNGDDPFPLCEKMKEVNKLFHNLAKQLQIRFSGENGVARGMMNIQNAFDTWISKLTLHLLGSNPLSDSEWMTLYDRMAEYVTMVSDVIEVVGSQQLDDDRVNNLSHKHISVVETMKAVHEWMKSTVTDIEAEDGKLMARVSTIHNDLVRWMVQMLLNLVPNYDQSKRGAAIEPSMATTWTVDELVENAQSVSQHLTDFTNYASECCSQLVQSTMQKKRDHGDDDAENEYSDFLRVKLEASEWIRSSEFLLRTIVSKPVSLFTPEMTSQLQLPGDEQERILAEQKEAAEQPIKHPKSPPPSSDRKHRASPLAMGAEHPLTRAQRTTTKGAAKPSDMQDVRDALASYGQVQKRVSQDQDTPVLPQAGTTARGDVTLPKLGSPAPGTPKTAREALSSRGAPPPSPGAAASQKTTPRAPDTLSAVRTATPKSRVSTPDAAKVALGPEEAQKGVTGPDTSSADDTKTSSTANLEEEELAEKDAAGSSAAKFDAPGVKSESGVEEDLRTGAEKTEDAEKMKASEEEGATTASGGALDESKDVDSSSSSKQPPGRKSKAPAKEGKGKKVGKGAKTPKKSKEEELVSTTEEEEEQAPVQEEAEEIVDESKAQEALQQQLKDQLDTAQTSFTDAQPGTTQYQKLGADENIHLATLEDPDHPLDPDSLVHPTSSLMQSAYDAIAKMDAIQNELVTTEIRAQNAEKQLIDLQENLNSATQKIRSLEKTIKAMEAAQSSPAPTPDEIEPPDIRKALDISDKRDASAKGSKPQSPTLDSAKRKPPPKSSPKPRKPLVPKKK